MSDLVKWLISAGCIGVSTIFTALALIYNLMVVIPHALNYEHKLEHGGQESEYLKSEEDKHILPAIGYFILTCISMGITSWVIYSFYVPH